MEENTQNYLIIALHVLGALALLIYGMKMMSEALQKMAGAQLRHILAAMTSNRMAGIVTGVVITAIVQSSSATTVMTVSFVNAGLLTLAQAISVIMGANIGTTLTAWIMSLGYNADLTLVTFPAFFAGIVLIHYRKHRYAGDFLFGIGFLFFSLVQLSAAGRSLDLEHNAEVVAFFSSFDTQSYLTVLTFLLIGTFITCVVQSSAAVMAITIMLCSTGVLPISLGIALVLGENIGTTMTANLAALGANTQARRAALAHLLFNVLGVVWVMAVFFPFVTLVCHMAGCDPDSSAIDSARLPIVLALFHTCFNLTNTLLLVGFIPQIVRICYRLIRPQVQEKVRLRPIQGGLLRTPELSLLQAQRETSHFAEIVRRMFGMVRALLDEHDPKRAAEISARIEKYEGITDRMEQEIATFLTHVGNAHLSDATKHKVRGLLRVLGELESMGDVCYNITRALHRKLDLTGDFTQERYADLRRLMALADELLEQMERVQKSGRPQHLRKTKHLETEIHAARENLREQIATDVNNRRCSYALGSVFSDMVDACGRLGDHAVNVVEARVGRKA
ncbi:MAG: Na/Pi cotransporter family protein [Alloprevotella sp.]|nr:Na/Pi cotransporter family protein [Alloprevotella sp.]